MYSRMYFPGYLSLVCSLLSGIFVISVSNVSAILITFRLRQCVCLIQFVIYIFIFKSLSLVKAWILLQFSYKNLPVPHCQSCEAGECMTRGTRVKVCSIFICVSMLFPLYTGDFCFGGGRKPLRLYILVTERPMSILFAVYSLVLIL